jgi:DNA-directed RNA polymerase subunit N (RpoN/RPB10)
MADHTLAEDTGAGCPVHCGECGQPPAVRYEPTERAGTGWVARDDGQDGGARFVPVYRCPRHLSNRWRGYTARLLAGAPVST